MPVVKGCDPKRSFLNGSSRGTIAISSVVQALQEYMDSAQHCIGVLAMRDMTAIRKNFDAYRTTRECRDAFRLMC
jgi:hypothetical protein